MAPQNALLSGVSSYLNTWDAGSGVASGFPVVFDKTPGAGLRRSGAAKTKRFWKIYLSVGQASC